MGNEMLRLEITASRRSPARSAGRRGPLDIVPTTLESSGRTAQRMLLTLEPFTGREVLPPFGLHDNKLPPADRRARVSFLRKGRCREEVLASGPRDGDVEFVHGAAHGGQLKCHGAAY